MPNVASSSDSVAVAISPRWNSAVTRAPGCTEYFVTNSSLSARSLIDAPRRIRMTVLPSPRGIATPPSDGASRISNSARFVRFDLRARLLPPPRPNAPAVPPPGPRPRPPPPPGRPAKPPPPPGAPPGRWNPPPAPPGRPGPPGRCWNGAPGRPVPGPPGRGAPGRGAPGRGAAGRGIAPPAPPGRGMPCEPAKGLLPGRGVPGRDMPWALAYGLLPGRGAPGVASGAGALGAEAAGAA